eukprot:gene23070-54932_t
MSAAAAAASPQLLGAAQAVSAPAALRVLPQSCVSKGRVVRAAWRGDAAARLPPLLSAVAAECLHCTTMAG